tara:strand:+ start:1925 stop:2101 length:177 start_codon:yes stop_codon:yes gene_type:complete
MYKAMIVIDAEERFKSNKSNLYGKLTEESRKLVDEDLLKKVPRTLEEVSDDEFAGMLF